jgi:PAS domain S-box-containing protein
MGRSPDEYANCHKKITPMVSTSILIVTGDGNAAHELSERLTKLGYRVAGIATSNEELIAKMEESKPSLILTDIRLNGGREGIKTGRLIHSNYDTPIVYITGGTAGQTTIRRAGATGPFGYIFKPFDEKQIYAAVETALLRHALEAELREGRRWFNAVLDGIGEGVIALDNRGEIRFINPIARELTGWSEIETMGKTLYEVFALLDESSHERMQILDPSQSLLTKKADTKLEGLLLSKYGKTTPVEADVTILKDGEGRAAGMVLVFRDITKRREDMREIQRKSQQAEALVETAARLNAQLELTSVLDTVCATGNQALKASATGVFLQDSQKEVFNLLATRTELADLRKFSELRFEIPRDVFESFLSPAKPVTLIDNIQSYPNPPYFEFLQEQNIHTMGIAGLYQQHDLMGVLVMIYIGEPVRLSEDTLALLKGLADQAAISITNASLFEQVQKGREHQNALVTQLVEVQESERRHLAAELHDQIGQVLTGLQFMLESSKNPTGGAHVNQIIEAQDTVSGLIEQIREMSLNLRPPMLDDIGLLPTLLWHFERYTKQTGVEVIFVHSGITERLSPEIETTVYRIIQEALTNVARYAQVNEAFVKLTLQEKILGIEVTDFGFGFDSSAEGFKWSTAGLAGMRERANMLGGYLVVKSAPNEGTQILAMLPLDQKPMERRNRARNTDTG